jgi:hypothetical protein
MTGKPMPATIRDWLLLPGLERHADFGLLLLRVVTGLFLLYQSHDNVLSAARMAEFAGFPVIAAPR